MYDKTIHSFTSQFLSLEKTVHLSVKRKGQGIRVKIEVYRNHIKDSFTVSLFTEERVAIQKDLWSQATDPPTGVIWVRQSMAWVEEDSADAALTMALSLLKESCDPV